MDVLEENSLSSLSNERLGSPISGEIERVMTKVENRDIDDLDLVNESVVNES